MAKSKFNEKQITEINGIISKINESIKKGCEICARNPVTLKSLLAANKLDKNIVHFSCKPEYSEPIVSYFKKEKGLTVSRFSGNMQSSICLIY
jgi:hypothetical protein